MVGEVLDRLISVSVGGDVHVCLENAGGNTTLAWPCTNQRCSGLCPVVDSENTAAPSLWKEPLARGQTINQTLQEAHWSTAHTAQGRGFRSGGFGHLLAAEPLPGPPHSMANLER